MAQRIFKLLAARDIVQIDSPVSGGVSGAEKGTLAVMASGPRAEIAAIEPALAKSSARSFSSASAPARGRP
jgi:3-hydroxyisobutyrate dehydrogenase-like beta-hydroxyacid dehydrogenase